MYEHNIPGHFSSVAHALDALDPAPVSRLADDLFQTWISRRQLFLCGNGGSAANCIHWANDLLFPLAGADRRGINARALVENPAILTCVANDMTYADVFAIQLRTMAREGDLLLALSGSGNSPNVVEALKAARDLGVRSCALVAFDGGQCAALADYAIQIPVHQMQVAEDLQLIINHAVMLEVRRQIDRHCALSL